MEEFDSTSIDFVRKSMGKPIPADKITSIDIMHSYSLEAEEDLHICSQEDLSVKSGLGPFGLMVLASNDMEEYTSVYLRILKSNGTNKNTKYVVLMCSDQSRSSLNEENDKATFGAFVAIDPTHETISLRTLIDHSIVESYGGGGKVCTTSRVYAKLANGENANLFVFNKGTLSVDVLSLSAWSLKSAQINEESLSPFIECEDSHSLNQS